MEYKCSELPNVEKIERLMDVLSNVVFPGFYCPCLSKEESLKEAKSLLEELLGGGEEILSRLDEVRNNLEKDLEFFYDSDPAVDSKEEIIYAYPGFKAILIYRIAHIIYSMGHGFEARVMSEIAHSKTGIDINPGATIGSPFFIDHGTGVVIGETAIVGDRVKIYQGVTLGALSLSKGHLLKGKKRHPTIGNEVTIYSGASILGDITIGDNVVIGSNVFLLHSVESNTRVVISEPKLEIKPR